MSSIKPRQYLYCIGFISFWLCSAVQAVPGGGMISDGTVGTQVNLQDQTIAIQGGTALNGNLLHSFREFNVETGQTADFQAAEGTQHIISRVTGTNDSWIDGNIQSTTSDADLYLVNPNGVVFGKNASLNVNGAFHASTAHYVTLADGQQVYADSNQGVTLTVAAPEAFGFLDTNVGTIQVDSSQLSVKPGEDMSLVGGEINISSGARLQAAGGRIDLVAVDSVGEVQQTAEGITSTALTKANISVSDSILIVDNQADSQTVGKIMMEGGQVTVIDGKLQVGNKSTIDATGNSMDIQAVDLIFIDAVLSASITGSGQGGSVVLKASNEVSFNNWSNIILDTESTQGNAGDSGNLIIEAKDISFTDGATLNALTFGSGQGGSVVLKARNIVSFDGYSDIILDTKSTQGNAGNAGNLAIEATDIFFWGSSISSETYGSGEGGSVTLKGFNNVDFSGISFINIGTKSTQENAGNSGNLTIESTNISFTDISSIDSSTKGFGQGGSVVLKASNEVSFNDWSDIILDTESTQGNAGNAGDLMIEAKDIFFDSGSEISASTEGSGQSGLVTLKAHNVIDFSDDANIFLGTASMQENAGNAGNLMIEAKDILLYDSWMSSETKGSGQGGLVTLKAHNTVYLSDSTIYLNALSMQENAGNAGELLIEATDIMFDFEAGISTSTNGSGRGGLIALKARKNVNFDYDCDINLDTYSTKKTAGSAGEVTIEANNISFTGNSWITAVTRGAGQGGLVNLNAVHSVSFQNSYNYGKPYSGIFVGTESEKTNAGNGGKVLIKAADIVLADETSISAVTSGLGQGGSVTLKAREFIQLTGKETKVVGLSQGTGAAGSLRLEAPKLMMDDGATIDLEAIANGDAGRIELELGELLMQNAAKLTTSTTSTGHAGGVVNAEGKPLGIFITANNLTMETGAAISSESKSTGVGGNAGLVQIDLSGSMRLSGGSLIKTSTAGRGNAGNIIIGGKARPVALWMNGASIIESGSSSVQDQAGSAGNLTILTGETFDIQGNSALTTASKNAGGGGIEIQTRDRLRLQDSKIVTSVEGGIGQGGNIDIDPVFIILENSLIQANAHGGSGGNISLVADYLLKSGPTTIEASSTLSTSGNVDVQAVNVDSLSLQVATEIESLNVTQWQPEPCSQRRGGISRLIMAGYDAHPTPIDDFRSSLSVWVGSSLSMLEQSRTSQTMPIPSSVHPASMIAVKPIPLTILHGYSLAAAGSLSGCDVL